MSRITRLLSTSVLSIGLAAFAGCDSDGKYPVSGSITWEGAPIPADHNGYVTLTPVDGSSAPDSGPIVDSKFDFRASPGEKKVEIMITRPHGEVVEAMGAAPHRQYIPTRYNEESDLTATVESKSNDFQFDLVSQKGDTVIE